MSDKKVEGWGNSLFGVALAIVVIFGAFGGEPDIAESARIWIGKAAGTIPANYVWPGEVLD